MFEKNDSYLCSTPQKDPIIYRPHESFHSRWIRPSVSYSATAIFLCFDCEVLENGTVFPLLSENECSIRDILKHSPLSFHRTFCLKLGGSSSSGFVRIIWHVQWNGKIDINNIEFRLRLSFFTFWTLKNGLRFIFENSDMVRLFKVS